MASSLDEFETFNGRSCSQKLLVRHANHYYNDKYLYRRSEAGNGKLRKKFPNGHKDFLRSIELAKKCQPPKQIESGE